MTIADNLQQVRDTIAAACARVNRSPDAVTLVAVSKTHSIERVLEAIAAGAQHFGENRVEEGEAKIPAVMRAVQTPVMWHMIGHVQSRKAKQVAPLFQLVHSVDTVKLADKFSRAMQEQDKALDVLLEINVSGEASKSGFQAVNWESDAVVREALWSDVQQVLALPCLRVLGLMTMAPIVPDMEDARPVFRSLAWLRAALSDTFSVDLPHLSMGMTDDYPVAVEEGATIVRVGRAIFGEREAR